MTKAPTPTDKSIQKATWQHKYATKNFDYTTIVDRLRKVSWGKLCNQKYTHLKISK